MKLLEEMNAYARGQGPARAPGVVLAVGRMAAHRDHARRRRDAIRDIRPLVRLNVSVVVEEDGRQESGSFGGGGRSGYETYLDPDYWQGAVDEALRQALVNLQSVPAPAGEMTVVLGPGWPGILLHEAIGHGLEGDFNRKKTSAFAGLLGQRVAAPGVTVVDDGTIDGRRGSLTIDDEGTPTSRTVLIEDGILKGYMQDRQNARLMGVAPTGNGRRQVLCRAGDAAHDQHLHAGRRQGPGGNPRQRQEGHLCRAISAAARSTSPPASSSSPAPRPI